MMFNFSFVPDNTTINGTVALPSPNATIEPEILAEGAKANTTTSDANSSLFQLVSKIVISMVAVEVFFGVIGNTISLAVFCRRAFRGSTAAIYFRTLAVVDSLLLILVLAMLIPECVAMVIKIPILCYAMDCAALTIGNVSIYTLMLLTAQRLIAIVWPHRAKTVLTVKQSVISLISLILVLLIINSHDFWFMDRSRCIKGLIIYPTTDKVGAMISLLNSLKNVYLPFSFMSISNGVIIVHVRRHKKKMQKFMKFNNTKPGQNEENKSQNMDRIGCSEQTRSTYIEESSTNIAITNGHHNNIISTTNILGRDLGSESKEPSSTMRNELTVPRMVTKEQSKTSGQVKSSSSGRDKGIVITLVALNVCFIVTRAPHFLHNQLYVGQTTPEVMLVKGVLIAFMLLNNCSNVFLYVATGSKFRREFINMFKEVKNLLKLKIMMTVP